MKTSRFISVQDPAGLWTPIQLIGASVKIKSTSIASGLFCFDAESTYIIDSIGLRVNRQGKAHSVVKLEGLSGEFSWKDVEVTGLSFYFYAKPICGKFCSGMAKCGYALGDEDRNKSSNSELTLQDVSDGDILD